MRRGASFLILLTLSLAALPTGVSAGESIALRFSSVVSPEPLTTEAIWKLDPEERNAHRARWFVERAVEPVGLQAGALPKGGFGIRLQGIQAQALLRVRPEGTAFAALSDFNCASEPDTVFATRIGAERAAERAAAIWKTELEAGLPRLEAILTRLKADTAESAIVLASAAIRLWSDGVTASWQSKAKRQARAVEWAYYQKEARAAGYCPLKNRKPRALSWREFVGAPPAEQHRRVAVRAPAKRVAGLYTVRLSIAFGDKRLNGRFIVDSGASASLVSPSWLLSQGINPALVTVSGVPPVRVQWTGGEGLARRALALETQLADLKIPMNEFLLLDTALFSPPEAFATCCDGVLGSDFLRLFAVEFQWGPPPAIVLYDRAGFSHGVGTPWVEVAQLPTGDAVSSACELRSEKGAVIPGARWDSGVGVAAEAHLPWTGSVRAGAAWSLQCGPAEARQTIARGVPLSSQGIFRRSPALTSRNPGFNVGAQLLGRGGITIDLSNGRLWYDPSRTELPFLLNRSGISAAFKFNPQDRGARELRVTRIAPGSPAAKKLVPAGLKPGSLILEVDDLPADEMDIWDVEDRLSGTYASVVHLKWRGAKGEDRLAPLLLAP